MLSLLLLLFVIVVFVVVFVCCSYLLLLLLFVVVVCCYTLGQKSRLFSFANASSLQAPFLLLLDLKEM